MTKPAILVATWEDGLFVVTSEQRTQEFSNQSVRGLASDGRGGALAIVGGHALWRREPAGEWVCIATSECELSCSMAVADTLYVGTDDARMLRLSPGGSALDAIDGFDRVEGRDTWFAGSAIINGQRVGPPLGIRSVAANADGSVLFANVHVGGIPRSIDGGRTWQPTIDINADVHEICAHPTDPSLVAAAAAVGLCISRDAGATWIIERQGLHEPHCSAVAFCGDDIFVSAATDPFVPKGRLYRRPIKPDGRVTEVEGGLPLWTEGIVHSGCIAARGSSMAVADRGGNLYTSVDFGKTWSCNSAKLPMPGSVLIC